MNDMTQEPVPIVNNISRQDLTESVRANSLLADLTISLWSGLRTDQHIGAQLKADAGAVGNTGHYVKNLLAGCDKSLKSLRASYTQARQTHYALTLPWVSNPHAERASGARLLSNLHFQRYVSEMGKLKREAENQLDGFVHEYPDLVVQAQANLAGLARAADYPSPDEVKAAFKLSFDFTPIPAADAFQNLPDQVLEQLGARLQRRQVHAAMAAQSAMWERVREAVGHLSERLIDEKQIFKASSVESVRELIGLLPGFNTTGDARVDAVVADIQSMLDGVNAEDIRKHSNVRQDVVGKAQAITEKLSNWGV